MKLNIVTSNAEQTFGILKECFINESVEIGNVYPKTADFTISSKTGEEAVYPIECLIELSYYIDNYSIRVY